MEVLGQDDLPSGNFSRSFVGEEHDGVGVSMIFVEAGPGQGPSLHTHPYMEIHIAQSGEALFVADGEERVVKAGEIVLVPAGEPHSFEAREHGFSEIAIHASSRFVTEWLSGA